MMANQRLFSLFEVVVGKQKNQENTRAIGKPHDPEFSEEIPKPKKTIKSLNKARKFKRAINCEGSDSKGNS